MLSDKNNFPGVDIVRFGSNINQILYRETIKGVSILEQLKRTEKIFDMYYRIEEIIGMENYRYGEKREVLDS